jgi:hypothetical protein
MQQDKSASQPRRRTPDEIKAILVAYRSSGLSQREFAQKRSIPVATLSHWLRRERKNGKSAGEKPTPSSKSTQEFIPVRFPEPAVSPAVLEFELPDGLRVRVGTGLALDHLKKLVNLLRSC